MRSAAGADTVDRLKAVRGLLLQEVLRREESAYGLRNQADHEGAAAPEDFGPLTRLEQYEFLPLTPVIAVGCVDPFTFFERRNRAKGQNWLTEPEVFSLVAPTGHASGGRFD